VRPVIRLTALTLSCAAGSPRGYANCGMMVAAHTAGQRRVICNQHDAAILVFGPGASAPDRSRAAPASASSWAAITRGKPSYRMKPETSW
jgi:hypothetical protein